MKNRNSAQRRRIRRSYVVSTISVALVLFLLGMVGYAMSAVWSVAERVRSNVTMIVELDDNVSVDRREEIASRLREESMATAVNFVSKDEKIADDEFAKVFAVDIEGFAGENPLSDSFDVTLATSSANREALVEFADRCAAIEGVCHVSYPEFFIERMHSTLDTIELILLLFGATMAVVAFILLGNTVRLAIFARRETINTMKLVGATKWFIMKPFLATSAVQGLCAGLLAVGLFAAVVYALDYNMPGIGIASDLTELGIVAAAMVVVGIVLAVCFTAVAVSRFVNMKSNKIYLY